MKGEGNSLDFGARIYDSRLGRWLSVDPLQSKYPGVSPYNFAGNNPVLFKDTDGREIFIFYETGESNEDGTPVIASYKYGSGLELPNNDFVKDVVRSLDHIRKYDDEGVVEHFVGSTEIVNVYKKSIEDGGNYNLPYYYKNGNFAYSSIYWDPDYALTSVSKSKGYKNWDGDFMFRLTVTGSISPSTILFHEFGHSYLLKDINRNSALYKAKRKKFPEGSEYPHQHEKDVIDLENKYINNLNSRQFDDMEEAMGISLRNIFNEEGLRNTHNDYSRGFGIKLYFKVEDPTLPPGQNPNLNGTPRSREINESRDKTLSIPITRDNG